MWVFLVVGLDFLLGFGGGGWVCFCCVFFFQDQSAFYMLCNSTSTANNMIVKLNYLSHCSRGLHKMNILMNLKYSKENLHSFFL